MSNPKFRMVTTVCIPRAPWPHESSPSTTCDSAGQAQKNPLPNPARISSPTPPSPASPTSRGRDLRAPGFHFHCCRTHHFLWTEWCGAGISFSLPPLRRSTRDTVTLHTRVYRGTAGFMATLWKLDKGAPCGWASWKQMPPLADVAPGTHVRMAAFMPRTLELGGSVTCPNHTAAPVKLSVSTSLKHR